MPLPSGTLKLKRRFYFLFLQLAAAATAATTTTTTINIAFSSLLGRRKRTYYGRVPNSIISVSTVS